MFASSKIIHNIQTNGPPICRSIQTPRQRIGTQMQGHEVPHGFHAMHNRSNVPRQIVGQICTTNRGNTQYNVDAKNQHLEVSLRSTGRPGI